MKPPPAGSRTLDADAQAEDAVVAAAAEHERIVGPVETDADRPAGGAADRLRRLSIDQPRQQGLDPLGREQAVDRGRRRAGGGRALPRSRCRVSTGAP